MNVTSRRYFTPSSMTRDVEITLPLKLTNPLNGSHGHWAPKAKLRKQQRDIVRWTLLGALMAERVALPVDVTVTRIAPRKLDAHDGLPAAVKGVVDGIADALGCKDNDPRVTWTYAQAKGTPKQYAVRILVAQRKAAA